MPSKVNNATYRSHGYNGIFRITRIASHCTGKPLFLVPLRASVAQAPAATGRGLAARRCWQRGGRSRNTNGTESRTSGPCSRQKSYVRPIHPKRLCASGYSYSNANKRNGTEEILAEERSTSPSPPPPYTGNRSSHRIVCRLKPSRDLLFPRFVWGDAGRCKSGGAGI